MSTRLQIDPESAALPCEHCGHPTLHVARLVADNGTAIGQTMVCTACPRHRADPRAGVGGPADG
ncbi:hypothetical protein [Amycolatopsis sp. 195334CR]|uniref:hypothetical protein n=1 Tax=Amycolatopsis sp. 195334CR TaxID=2814588 RepID=UPI001A8F8CA0|nr:hypothetical protein [Amycolatopsis sp. 195334CR]MBN6038393.1 hypothetical protein [Amycolatopsis sp. 195334CR]